MNRSEEERLALVDNADELKKFAADLVRRVMYKTFFTTLADKDVPAQFADTVVNWRRFASDLGYDGPVVWAVKAGFTLKEHAPKAGPCYHNWGYLQEWKIKEDKPTTDSLIFFIPRIVGTKKNVKEQMEALAELRQRYKLPVNHLTSFGSAALLAGLIMTNFKRKGERTPINNNWVRTDSCVADGCRLGLDWYGGSLRCGDWDWEGERGGHVGAFALGVEKALGR